MPTTRTSNSTIYLRGSRSRAAVRATRRVGTWSAYLALLALWVPVVAQAAPTWLLPAQTLSTPNAVQGPRVAVDPQGNAVAVWARQSGSQYFIQASSRPAGGTWSTPQDISPIVTGASRPKVAVDARGNATAIWFISPPPGPPAQPKSPYVQAATRPAGGNWSAPQTLGDMRPGDGPELAVNARGDAAVIWQDSRATTAVIRATTRPAGGDWAPTPQDLTPADKWAEDPTVALDAKGNALAAWRQSGGAKSDLPYRIDTARLPAGGAWGPPQTISASGRDASEVNEAPRIAVDLQGNAVALWSDRSPSGDAGQRADSERVFAASAAKDGKWGPAQQLTEALSRRPQVAFDGQGNAVAVWAGTEASRAQFAADRSTAGVWSPPQNIGVVDVKSSAIGDGPQLAVNAQGDAVVLSGSGRDQDADPRVVRATRRPAGGAWSPQVELGLLTPFNATGLSVTPSVAIDDQGNAAGAWRAAFPSTETGGCIGTVEIGGVNFVDGCSIIKAAGFDAAGPQLRDLNVPAAATVGSPVAFSVAPLDVWSAVASTHWDFGDGSGADGASSSHVYTAPGAHEVTVTSTDSLDNASVQARTVVVTTAPVQGGEPAPQLTPAIAAPAGTDAAGGTDALRARGLRRCLTAVARDRALEMRRARSRTLPERAKARRHAARGRQRCLARYGRTPGRVTGFRPNSVSATKIVLRFLAPGSDGTRGPAARGYVVKQSLRPVRDARDFERAHSLCGGTCRFAGMLLGQRVTLRVTGLRRHTRYYYAIRARDNVSGRLGPRSHTVKVKTR